MSKNQSNQQWNQQNNSFFPVPSIDLKQTLPVGVYLLSYDGRKGFFLNRTQDKFTFPYKIYGIEKDFINRVHKTYTQTKGNLGILLNGVKGTGKTVTAELICNQIHLPVIIINRLFDDADIPSFLNSIETDIIVFFDEYEKIYDGYDNDILSVMDGVLNTKFRKIFVLTTNTLHINTNMLSRPGRIRYVKNFKDLKLETIIEIIDDKLLDKNFKDEIIKYISGLSIITVDIVKSVIEEVNIHNEVPDKFKDILNVKQSDNRWNVYEVSGINPIKIFGDVKISPKEINERAEGDDFVIDNNIRLGYITEVLSEETFIVEIYRSEYDKFIKPLILKEKITRPRRNKIAAKTKPSFTVDNTSNKVPVRLSIERCYSAHQSFYNYGI